ncbi:MAG: putative beta-lactamase HcpC precursor [Firmicutes bacterium ADurb.Bin456]|nr:MAG: putative beta-lactamase HcpC precursor [Firmicutes bacterium ADurb.Bin456]
MNPFVRYTAATIAACLLLAGCEKSRPETAEAESPRSIEQLRLAAEQGDAQAQNDLGAAYYDGTGVDQDIAEAVKWLRSAAEQEIPSAQSLLAWSYFETNAVSGLEAVKWARKAADRKDPSGAVVLELLYLNDLSAFDSDPVVMDFRHLLPRAEREARQGNPAMQALTALIYHYGTPKPNTRKAVKWIKRAAEQLVEARVLLGHLYYLGEEVRQNKEEGLRLIREAAEQGSCYGQCILGVILLAREKDGEGIKWLRLAAEQGVEEAQFLMGALYSDGRYIPQDYPEAARWYRLAAEQGYAEAQQSLGHAYLEGQGVPKDEEEAARWFMKATLQGHEPDSPFKTCLFSHQTALLFKPKGF